MAGNNLYKYGLAAGLGLAALIEHDNLDILYHTLSRDVRTMATYARIIAEYKKLQRMNKTVPDYFYDTVKTYGDKPMIIFAETEEVWTFNDVNKMSNQVAHFLIQYGYKKGDTVAIFMTNQPKYMVALLGLAKIGVTAALINNNLTHEVILHPLHLKYSHEYIALFLGIDVFNQYCQLQRMYL